MPVALDAAEICADRVWAGNDLLTANFCCVLKESRLFRGVRVCQCVVDLLARRDAVVMLDSTNQVALIRFQCVVYRCVDGFVEAGPGDDVTKMQQFIQLGG